MVQVSLKSVTKRTLSIDLGSNLGWALHSNEGITSGVLSLKEKGKFSPRGFEQLYCWMTAHKLIAVDRGEGTKNFEMIVEVPHCGKFMAANRILFGLLAMVNMFCSNNEIKLTEYRPKAIKKYWTGNGNANKAQMLAASKERGMVIKDHNENDALAMLYFHTSKGAK
jgi:crossover junction endodeoxyribonuclease RuvC